MWLLCFTDEAAGVGWAAFMCAGARSVTGAERGMRTVFPLCGGGGGGGDDEEEHRCHHRSRAGWMKRLLWVRSSHCLAVHTDTKPGVWLRSFHSLDTDGQNEVRLKHPHCCSAQNFTQLKNKTHRFYIKTWSLIGISVLPPLVVVRHTTLIKYVEKIGKVMEIGGTQQS